MEVLRIPNLFARRSTRHYTPEPVGDDQVQTVLRAAMAAPSAGDRKPWHFVVVRDPKTRLALTRVHPYAQMLREASVCIVVCGEPQLGYPGTEEFWIQDVSAATENMLLAATGLGLGVVWCGVYPLEDRVRGVRCILGIPEQIVPFSFVPLGYPSTPTTPRTQHDPNRVHREHW